MRRARGALLTSPSQLPGAARALRLGSRVGAWRATEVVLVVALVAAAGALIVLVGIQHPPAAAPQASAAAPQALEEEAVPRP